MLQLPDGTFGNASGLTVIVKFCVALKLGRPLSVTFRLTGLMMLALAKPGRQLIAALVLFD